MNNIGHFCWNELLSKNVEKDKAFYKAVFDWDSEDKQFGDTNYTVFKANGVDIAGMMATPAECTNQNSVWFSYVTVDNVEKMLQKAETAGAKIILQKLDIEGVGTIAAILDESGASVGFFKPEAK